MGRVGILAIVKIERIFIFKLSQAQGCTLFKDGCLLIYGPDNLLGWIRAMVLGQWFGLFHLMDNDKNITDNCKVLFSFFVGFHFWRGTFERFYFIYFFFS